MSSLASSSKRSAPCSICEQPSKYTCPRCAAQTCSLPCSKKHKSTMGCNGIRDPARYVPMNEFGYGKLMDDYVYLEQGKRNVDEWNKGIADDGKRAVVGKREGLKSELRKRGCIVDFLPEGMERRTLNASSWNPKTQTLQLTYQLVLPDGSSHIIPRTILTASAASTQPATPQSLLTVKQCQSLPAADTLVFAVGYYQPLTYPVNPTPSKAGAVKVFKPLEAAAPLVDQLDGLAFLEFPTLYILEKDKWDAQTASGDTVALALPEVAHPPTSTHQRVASSNQQSQTRDSGWGARGVKRPAEVEMEAAKKPMPAPATASTPAAVLPPPSVSALVDYASDSDAEVELGVADDTPGELVVDARVLDALIADQAVRG